MTKIQLRHDTSDKWQTANPILASGEIGVETDTQKIKVGNGSTAYNSLQYIGTTRKPNETSLNDIIEPGTYYFTKNKWANTFNKPFSGSSYTVAWMIVISYDGGNTAQIVFSGSGNNSDCDFAVRYKISSKWKSWHYVRPTNVLGYNIPYGLVLLDSTGKLPAVDGSQLKNLPATTPSNMVTTDTNQTITGDKVFTGVLTLGDNSSPIYVYTNGTGYINTANLYTNNLTVGGYYKNNTQSSDSSQSYISFVNTNHSIHNPANLLLFDYQDNFTVGRTNYPLKLEGSTITANGNNIVTTNDIGNLKYWTGVETDYIAIGAKDPDTLYRTTDTNKVYLGTIQLGG